MSDVRMHHSHMSGSGLGHGGRAENFPLPYCSGVEYFGSSGEFPPAMVDSRNRYLQGLIIF